MWRRAIELAACALLVAGCGSDPEREKPSGKGAPTVPPARSLPAEWYEDPDGDIVPTAAERLVGTDPHVDECARKASCGRRGEVNALESSNTLLILDSSGSMAGGAGGGTTKIAAAKRALRRYVAGMPDSLAVGFMVYGHKGGGRTRSCAAVDLLEPIATAASQRFDRVLRRFKPTGRTPLARALREARRAFAGKAGEINRIILVTDGVETCGGDPVSEARRLKEAGIGVTTDVVGFDVAKPAEARRLRAIADAAGGTYTDARTAADLDDYVAREGRRASRLVGEYVCVMSNRTRLSICSSSAITRAYIAIARRMNAAPEPEATAYARVLRHLDDAGRARNRRLERRGDELTARLDRELAEARRRLERLGG